MEKGQKVYVSSSDSRLNGYSATVISVGNKYITVEDEYGMKRKFYKDSHNCVDWCIYHVWESEDAYNDAVDTVAANLSLKRTIERTRLTKTQIDRIMEIINE